MQAGTTVQRLLQFLVVNTKYHTLSSHPWLLPESEPVSQERIKFLRWLFVIFKKKMTKASKQN